MRAVYLGIVAAAMVGGQAQAISVTQNTNADDLAAALLMSGGGGLTVTSATLEGQNNGLGAVSSGTFINNAGTYNSVGPGVVLSTGNVSDYETGPNIFPNFSTGFATSATPAQQALITPITGFPGFDVTQLDMNFDVDVDTDKIFFNVVWGTEEFPEFIGSEFKDAFGIYLNGTNIALFDGLPVNVDHPNMASVSGTELDGVLDPSGDGTNPIMLFEGLITPGSTDNLLTFIIADTGDNVLDSTVYISGFGSSDPGGGNPGGGDIGVIPVPAALPLFITALAGLGVFGRRRRAAS